MNFSKGLLFIASIVFIDTCKSQKKCSCSQFGNEAILVTGGTSDGYTRLSSVEVWRPGCQGRLPDMMEARSDHAQAGLRVCSGLATAGQPVTSCERLEAGGWVKAGAVGERSASSMWGADTGEVFIMGGAGSEQNQNTTLQIEGGITKPGFALRSPIVATCAIDDGSSVVLTGGAFNPVSVQRYDKDGFVDTLPDLNLARFHHGCSSYLRNDEKVYIVTGGRPSAQEDFISSTEVLKEGNTEWRQTGNLPVGLFAGRMATLDNRVFYLGGFKKIDGNFIPQDMILEYLDDEWKQVGTLLQARGTPGVSTVLINSDMMEICE